MTRLLTPARQRGVEILDEAADPVLQRRSHRDIALANTLFGGVHAVQVEFDRAVPPSVRELTLLDVGTGTGDIPAILARRAARRGVTVHVLGLDGHRELVAATREWPAAPVCANALELPFADASIDVVCCSQVLHHFLTPDAEQLIREMHRVARRRVIIADLLRNRLAAAALWTVSFPLGFHPVSRHDGVVSIYRGFTREELRAMVRTAVAVEPDVQLRFAFRVTASWSPRA